MIDVVEVHRGGSALILSMPHCGQDLVPEVEQGLNGEGRAIADTDWWIEKLYGFHRDLDASVVQAKLSRYVIDLNRDPSGASLYPGQATTGLCPVTTFDGETIYNAGAEPDEAEIKRRVEAYYEPYHRALVGLIEESVKRHGYALLFDCHSIRSAVPRLFEGRLPDFNIGSNDGSSCDPAMADVLSKACRAAPGLTTVVNGRFKGGWITRHYGDPAGNVHALQLELAQCAYMEEAPPWTYQEPKAAIVGDILKRALGDMIGWAQRNLGETR